MSYIDREKAILVVKDLLAYGIDEFGMLKNAIGRLENIPTEDVAPVKHGRWLVDNTQKDYEGDYKVIIKCNCCGKTKFLGCSKYKNEYSQKKFAELGNISDYNYCGRCGAKMDLESGEGNGQ